LSSREGWYDGCMRLCLFLGLIIAVLGSPALAQVELPAELTEFLSLERTFEVASYSDESGGYFAVAGVPSDSSVGAVDAWLARLTNGKPEVLFRLSEHASLPSYMAVRRATSVSRLRIFDVDWDGHPDLFLHVACECLDLGSDVMVDGATHRAVAYRRAETDEGTPVYPTFFEPLPAGHELAVHAAYVLGGIYENPFGPVDPAFDEAVEDREFAIDISPPRILEP
jgi:hypothetical protein